MKKGDKNEKVKYLIETYVDEYRTLEQNIIIDLDLDKASYGNESKYIRSRINPNLNKCVQKVYLDKEYNIIEKEFLINNEWVKVGD